MSTNVADTLLIEALQTPWAITEAGLATIVAVLTRTSIDVEALEKERGRKLSNDGNAEVEIRDGVAIIPIAGPMIRRGNFFSRISAATSYDRIAADLALALETPTVRAILLNIDSPGGEVTGVSDLAAMVRAGVARKPIVVHSDGVIGSAAYWIASAASEIVVSDTTVVGSIGIRMTMSKTKPSPTDRSVQYEFVSSRAPKKSVDPETDAGRASILETVNAMEEVFFRAVAQYRGVTVDTVAADFGQGDVFVGARARAAGMVDRLASFEDTLARLASRSTTSAIRVGVPRAMATPPSPLNPGAQMQDEPGATANGEPTAAQLEAHGTTVRTAERTRITELLALSSVTIDAALVTAISDGTSAPQYAYAQALAAKAENAATAKAEAAAKQAFLDGQAKNEAALAAAGVKVPVAPAIDTPPNASADKKNRLLAAAQRTGAAKTPITA